MSDKSRLSWRCRRGMREMDILFERFVEDEYDNLTLEQRQLFESFLDEPDVDIYSWISGTTTPEIEAYKWFICQFQKIHS